MDNSETNNNNYQVEDPGKTVAILSYCTLIGLIIAFVLNSEQKNKSELGVFHLRQALGIFATFFAAGIAGIILFFIPFLGLLAIIGTFVLWLLGLIAAINSERKAVPLLGDFYQNLFRGIS